MTAVESTHNYKQTDLFVFIQVFPYEYQRALKQLAEQKVSQPILNGNSKPSEPNVKDIEDAIADGDMEKRKLDKIR